LQLLAVLLVTHPAGPSARAALLDHGAEARCERRNGHASLAGSRQNVAQQVTRSLCNVSHRPQFPPLAPLPAAIFAVALDFAWINLHRRFMDLAITRHWTVAVLVGILVSTIIIAFASSMPVK